ncbi:MAG TPA: dephospho-CoA kinase [Flavobacteriaceae bacterium]|nr:dephospho-CoA kinase [Flavobacteriaceae bacterium]
MKIIGLTGGIGSGKTTVARMFEELGVPVYYADDEAKKLNDTSETIKTGLTNLLGNELYKEGKLDRKKLAEIIFSDKKILEKVNQIIHPEVAAHFKEWVSRQKSPYVLKEAAILFESGSYQFCDAVILVTAPEEERILRVMQRDNVTREQVMARMRNQWPEEQKKALADYIIENLHQTETLIKVKNLHILLDADC